MMERRESNLTHRQPSNKASLAWLLVCAVGAALFAVLIATHGALAQDSQDPVMDGFRNAGPWWTKQEHTIRSSSLASPQISVTGTCSLAPLT